jgi:hypothetical protein
MPILQVDSLQFTFSETVTAEKYDDWFHYRSVWNRNGRQKAMDVVAIEISTIQGTTWLIEVKDYRVIDCPPKPSNLTGLPQTVADKAIHTVNGLKDAASKATIISEREHAVQSLTLPVKRVILHLEPHKGPRTALFPSGFSANVLQKLKQLVSDIDPNPLVLNMNTTPAAGVPWEVA